MSNTAFSTPGPSSITQPTSATALVIRSTSASDTAGLSIYGTVSGVAAVDSSTGTNGKLEMVTSDTFTAISQLIFGATAAGTITASLPGTAATGDIRADLNPVDGATLTLGLTGYTKTYRFKDTLASAFDVKIGATKEDTAANLNAAINSSGTPGVEYYAGTTAHPIYSSTVSVDVITLTDKVPCARQLDTVITESASNFSKRVPIGGVDGAILATIAIGSISNSIPLTFSTEDHSTATLPALMTAVSSYVQVDGRRAMLRLWSDNAIDYKIQSSTDLINWTDTSEGTDTLAASTLTFVYLAEITDFIRFVIVTNANTDDTILDARVIY